MDDKNGEWLDEQIRKFYDGERYYMSTESRCESRVIIWGYVCRCECAGKHRWHAFENTWRKPTEEEFRNLRVIDTQIEEVK